MRTTTIRPRRRAARLSALVGTALSLAALALAACADRSSTAPLPAERALQPSAPSAQRGALSGIDCGCSKTGPYVAPKAGKAIAVDSTGASPNGVYKVTATPIGTTINLRITKGTTDIAQYTVPLNAKWGFSPDDQRFVYHYTLGTAPSTTQNIFLYNLAKSVSTPVWQTAVATAPSRIVFSPNGRYLLHALTSSANYTTFSVVDALSGVVRYQSAFAFTVPAGTAKDTVGMATWGFSPDAQDRTFAWAFITGSNSAQWNAVNLTEPQSSALVFSEASVTPGTWSFSPCGDMLGVVRQTSASFVSVRVIQTRDGVEPHTGATYNGTTATVRTSTTDHIGQVNGVDQSAITANTASGPCIVVPQLSALTLTPTSLQGGADCTGKVTLTSAAPSGGTVVTLKSSNTAVATVPASITVPMGSTTASFTIHTNAVSTANTVTITGTATVAKSAALAVNPPPPAVRAISINPSTGLGFGDQLLGTTSGAKPVTLTNSGNTALAISDISTSADFGKSTDCPLAPTPFAVGATCTAYVTFSPSAAGARSGTLVVTSDATASPQSIPLSGNGITPFVSASVVPGSIGFGTLYLGTTTSGRIVKVTSNGNMPLVITAVTLGGTNPWDFGVWDDGCSGATLAPNTSCTFAVTFEPLAAGTRTATVTIAHNAPGSPSSVALSGAGVKPPGGYIP
ncbi:hypothetical protein J421_4147 [Gemmatirosa kalamazoonensis]|uniref:Abnormal spindle-like microcephaly-associated protein ASH domain-containing protein n=1 Tax=Gemmatirosa kalamazoonensis TaxID=861299 RepID=W0RKU6_9BACT|nr:choice-of-anchor D domain-containing protein [Gemmatirosa kalamazoonensis]AHG91684.1 hypothetical protein J421_4147 [Gemmatirosa kalamazoonensis]